MNTSLVESDITAYCELPKSTKPTVDEDNDSIKDYCKNREEYQFKERNDLQINEKFEYKREGKYPGYILIFNQDEFVKEKDYRKGSKKDVNDIIECLSKFGYNISKDDNIYNNLDADGIIKALDSVITKDLSEYNSIIIFFLSHGTENNIVQTRNSSIDSNIIISKITDCEKLKNKPKWFIFQTCKGQEVATNSDNAQIASKIVPTTTFSNKFIYEPNLIILYASVEDYKAFRHPIYGSWMIQELCKNITAYGRKEDVTSIIMRTTKCVSTNYFFDHRKQIPLFISTLTKKFYLTKSKDRNFLVEQEQASEEHLEIIKNIEKKLKINKNTKK